MAGSPAGREMAESAAYLVEVSLERLREVSQRGRKASAGEIGRRNCDGEVRRPRQWCGGAAASVGEASVAGTSENEARGKLREQVVRVKASAEDAGATGAPPERRRRRAASTWRAHAAAVSRARARAGERGRRCGRGLGRPGQLGQK
jgi:hypothetical protein